MEDKSLGSISFAGGSVTVSLVSNNVVASISYDNSDFTGSVSLTIKSKAGLEHLKVLIPGQVDDAIISFVEAALGL